MSTLRPEVSVSLQNRCWEQSEVAEASSERERKENIAPAQERESAYAGGNGTGESMVKQQEAESDAPA